MKERIQIPELRNYLGTNLLCENNNKFTVELSVFNISEAILYKLKPHVRPLSQLTQEIEVDGEKFVPIVELAKIEFPQYISVELIGNKAVVCAYAEGSYYDFYYNDTLNRFFFTNSQYKMNSIINHIEIFNKLFEWHFDVFGWIEKGLAIEKK